MIYFFIVFINLVIYLSLFLPLSLSLSLSFSISLSLSKLAALETTSACCLVTTTERYRLLEESNTLLNIDCEAIRLQYDDLKTLLALEADIHINAIKDLEVASLLTGIAADEQYRVVEESNTLLTIDYKTIQSQLVDVKTALTVEENNHINSIKELSMKLESSQLDYTNTSIQLETNDRNHMNTLQKLSIQLNSSKNDYKRVSLDYTNTKGQLENNVKIHTDTINDLYVQLESSKGSYRQASSDYTNTMQQLETNDKSHIIALENLSMQLEDSQGNYRQASLDYTNTREKLEINVKSYMAAINSTREQLDAKDKELQNLAKNKSTELSAMQLNIDELERARSDVSIESQNFQERLTSTIEQLATKDKKLDELALKKTAELSSLQIKLDKLERARAKACGESQQLEERLTNTTEEFDSNYKNHTKAIGDLSIKLESSEGNHKQALLDHINTKELLEINDKVHIEAINHLSIQLESSQDSCRRVSLDYTNTRGKLETNVISYISAMKNLSLKLESSKDSFKQVTQDYSNTREQLEARDNELHNLVLHQSSEVSAMRIKLDEIEYARAKASKESQECEAKLLNTRKQFDAKDEELNKIVLDKNVELDFMQRSLEDLRSAKFIASG
jgi:DNA repair exonuclease SbcCD ATPase subunit